MQEFDFRLAEERVKLKHAELLEYLHVAFLSKTTVLVMGGTGIGKSTLIEEQFAPLIYKLYYSDRRFIRIPEDIKDKQEIIEQIFKSPENFFVVITIVATQINVEDLKGLPYFRKTNGESRVLFKPHLFFEILTLPKIAGILFIDELLQTDIDTQKAFMNLISKGVIADSVKSGNVFIVIASNRPEDMAGVQYSLAPLQTRFAIVELLPPTAKELARYGAKMKWHIAVVSFLSMNDVPTYEFDEEKITLGVPIIVPRKYEYLSKMLYALEKRSGKSVFQLIDTKEGEKTIFKITASLLGKGIASQFITFLKSYKIKDMAINLLNQPELLDSLMNDPERLHNVFDFLTSYIISLVKDGADYDTIVSSLDKFYKLRLMLLDRKNEYNILISNKLKNSKEFMKFWKAHINDLKKRSDNIRKFIAEWTKRKISMTT